MKVKQSHIVHLNYDEISRLYNDGIPISNYDDDGDLVLKIIPVSTRNSEGKSDD